MLILLPSHWSVYKPGQWNNNKINFLEAEPNELIVYGAYSKLRNPQLVGIYFILIGEAIFFQSYYLFIYLLLIAIASVTVSIIVEEKQLLKRYGKQYELYAQSVARFIPKIKRYGNK
jgi:protein-S-isoprenylcysteine O-methyltransferase Ste14